MNKYLIALACLAFVACTQSRENLLTGNWTLSTAQEVESGEFAAEDEINKMKLSFGDDNQLIIRNSGIQGEEIDTLGWGITDSSLQLTSLDLKDTVSLPVETLTEDSLTWLVYDGAVRFFFLKDK